MRPPLFSSLFNRCFTCAAFALPLSILVCAFGSARGQTSLQSSLSEQNPLLTESTLSYRIPPFDRIKNEHFHPAFEQGMREQLKEIEAISGNTAKPSFDNTIVAFERSGRLLRRAERVFLSLTSAHTNSVLESLQRQLLPKLAAHRDTIMLDGSLFARV